MITIFNEQKEVQKTLADLNDFRQLLAENEFIVTMKSDAIKARRVLGLANTTVTPVYWNRGDGKSGKSIFTDWVISVN